MSTRRNTPPWRPDEERALTARSVIASTLLGVDPPRLPTLALVRSGELFGLREGSTRTALSRMAAAGEVRVDGDGYRLAGALLHRHARQREPRRRVAAWDGAWQLHIVPPGRRPATERTALRNACMRLGLAEVRDGVWARPANLDGDADSDAPPDSRADDARLLAASATAVRSARPDDLGPFLDAFDLTGWSTRARRLLDATARHLPRLERRETDALGDTFVLDAAVIRHLATDPMLPRELLPDSWPGDELRAAFDRFDAAFKSTWQTWYRAFRRR